MGSVDKKDQKKAFNKKVDNSKKADNYNKSDKKADKKFDKKTGNKSDVKPNKKSEDKADFKSPFTEENEKLKEAILALGGTKGDIKYLEQIDMEGDDLITSENIETEASLKDELKSFMTNIGLSASTYEQDVETEDESEEEEEEEQEEVGEESEEEDEEEEEEEEDDADEEELVELEKEEPIADFKIHDPKAKATHKNLLIQPTPFWYKVDLPTVSTTNVTRLSPEQTTERYEYAKSLRDEESRNSEKHPLLTSSNRSFMSNIITSGTLNDKVSALTLIFRESPLHGIDTLDTLMKMGRKKGRNEAVMAVTSLKDLFTGSVLPDRKLIYFTDRPLAASEVTDKHLLLWSFEDHLKKTYLEFLKLIEELARDTLMHVRNNMVTVLNDLLSHKPEQEQNLLKLLVNKLGDSDNKVAAKTSEALLKLLEKHPGMKMFVVRELEQLLMKSGTSEKTQYYAIITLNQTILTGRDTLVANKLVELYFVFFRKLLKITEDEEKEEIKNKKKNDKEVNEEEEEEEEKKPVRKNKKAEKREKEQKKKEQELEDQQTKMVAAILTGVNRAFHFANISDDVVQKHLEVLFRMTHASTFNAAIQALTLIFTISLSKQSVSDRFYRTLYESLLDPRISHSSKQNMYLNLLFKAIRADSDIRRVKAYVKRMVQIASRNQPAFVTGIFFLLSQLIQAQPGLRTMLITPEEDDDEEYFVDAPEEEDDDEKKQKVQQEKASRITNQKTEYDGRKRDPRFSNAEKSCLWELTPFRTHYHPSVVKYTEQLFEGEPIQNQPDLHQFSLMHFLDLFVYRNPKKTPTTKGHSIMQPLLGSRRDGGILFTKGSGISKLPMNSDAFLQKSEDQVDADEVFFHKYFNQKAKSDQDGKPTKKKSKSGEGEDDEDGEDEVWRAMMSSIPGGLDNEDDEDEDEDLDEDDEEDDEAMRALLMSDEDEVEEGEDDIEGLEDFEGEGDSAEDEGSDLELMNASDMEEEQLEFSNKRILQEDSDSEQEKATSKRKKQKKEKLPTFATYEDYAKLIENEGSDLE